MSKIPVKEEHTSTQAVDKMVDHTCIDEMLIDRLFISS